MVGYSLNCRILRRRRVRSENGRHCASLTSAEGDSLKLAARGRKLKRGILEYTLHPFSLVTGADNLSSSTQMPRLQLGRIVGDERIIENVARDIVYFLHNFFTGDGLGKEGSPSYTSWGISEVMEAIHGQRGAFDRTAPLLRRETQRDQHAFPAVFKHGLGLVTSKQASPTVAPSPGKIASSGPPCRWNSSPWQETHGGGIPDGYRDYLNIDPEGDPVVSLKLPMPLPSHLLGQNRKAILRSGEGDRTRTLSLDYTERVGHYHMAPLNLTLYAVQATRLASDPRIHGIYPFYDGGTGSRPFPPTIPWPSAPLTATRWVPTTCAETFRYFCRSARLQSGGCRRGGRKRTRQSAGGQAVTSARSLSLTATHENAYVVDVFRVGGGHIHDWTFHGNGHRFSDRRRQTSTTGPTRRNHSMIISGFTFTPVTPHPPGGRHCGVHSAFRNSVQVTATGRGRPTWGDVTEYPDPDGAPVTDDGSLSQITQCFDAPGSEIIAGTGPAQRWLDNRDLGEQMKLVTVRRPQPSPPERLSGRPRTLPQEPVHRTDQPLIL